MTQEIFKALSELQDKQLSAALCTIIHAQGSTPRQVGSKMLVFPDGSYVGSVGGGEMEARVIAEAKQALIDGKPRKLEYRLSDPQRGDPGVCGGQLEVFVDPILPRPAIVVVGGGHVGKAVAHLAFWLGFRVVVSDDRPEFCTPEAIPEGEAFFPGPLSELPGKMEITPQTYFVLVTRGVQVDVEALPALLRTPAGYIGVIGSRRRWETTQGQLREVGVSEEQLKRVRSPIGLDIHAETPEEIAVSILAEIIRSHRGGKRAG
ncbi:MAG: XdhC/CoxI family protein [Chloroflexota bacterium]